MKRRISLSQYVKRRNGVALGANGSLTNMLKRSFGAGSFRVFWQYWNPIWGYYLATLFFNKLKIFLPRQLALILTFVISGAIHDLLVYALVNKPSLLLTCWFLLIGVCVVVSDGFKINYSRFSVYWRVYINFLYLFISFILATIVNSIIFKSIVLIV